MSEQKNNTINEFFKVQQISDYQRAFEELKSKMEGRETKRRNVKQLSGSPANDNNEKVNQSRAAGTMSNDNCNDSMEYMCKKVSKKAYCCVLL